MSKKKHAGTHVGTQLGNFIGQYLWINPAIPLGLSQSESLRIIGGAIGIFVAVLAITKKLKWW